MSGEGFRRSAAVTAWCSVCSALSVSDQVHVVCLLLPSFSQCFLKVVVKYTFSVCLPGAPDRLEGCQDLLQCCTPELGLCRVAAGPAWGCGGSGVAGEADLRPPAQTESACQRPRGSTLPRGSECAGVQKSGWRAAWQRAPRAEGARGGRDVATWSGTAIGPREVDGPAAGDLGGAEGRLGAGGP